MHVDGRKLGLTVSDEASLGAVAPCDQVAGWRLNILETPRSVISVVLTAQAQELFANGQLEGKAHDGLALKKPLVSPAGLCGVPIESGCFSKVFLQSTTHIVAKSVETDSKIYSAAQTNENFFEVVLVTRELLKSWPPASVA